MTFSSIGIILIIGASGLIAQAVLVRELLCVFYGNELTLGLILGGWLLSEALGAGTAGYVFSRAKNRPAVFILLQFLFCLALPLGVLAARWAKFLLGIPPGSGIGVAHIAGISLAVSFPAGYAHGALFTASCEIFSAPRAPAARTTRLYAWEAAGTMLGGLIFTFALVSAFNSFQIARGLIAFNVLISALFVVRFSQPGRRRLLIAAVAAMTVLLAPAPRFLQQFSYTKLFPGQAVVEMRSSNYATIAATRANSQTTIYYNGLPVVSSPHPDLVFVEEFAHIPAGFHAHPRRVLLLGAGVGGILAELVKQPVERIDYVELDPLFIAMAQRHAPDVALPGLKDLRVRLTIDDARRFLNRTGQTYDLIMIGAGQSADLTANRLFTRESFTLLERRLNAGGILAFWLPGAPAYISAELRDATRVVLNAAAAFPATRIIPGDYFLVVSCADTGISDLTAAEVSRRLRQRGLETGLLTPDYLATRLDREKERWLQEALAGGSRRINRDAQPVGLFEAMRLWNRRFSPLVASGYAATGALPLWVWIAAALLVWGIAYQGARLLPSARKRIVLAYALGQSGFWAMVINLVLLFRFQNVYGTLYQAIGLTIAVFMSGVALGGFAAMRLTSGRTRAALLNLLIAIELFCALITFVLARTISLAAYPYWIFIAFFAGAGFLLGLIFPLGAALSARRSNVSLVAGELFAADVAGGWLAGILAGAILLPALGLHATLLLAGIVRVGSCAQLILFKINKKKI
ncbi:MAG TPA: hypothetical protein P5110_06760 [Candidatus Omnitrophota bacterium]|nr:hypothetical protein [Candidatus Omnitrophota bacterium]HRZ15191.1 hypothetical protein [Candidatus Omnitrophota bacterium]